MKRHRAAIVVFVAVMGFTRPSYSSIFGEENVQLATLVGLKLEELANLSAILTQIKYMIQGVNDVAAGVRQGYRIYRFIRNYSLQDLKRDAVRGLTEAFPELRDIHREVELLRENNQAVNDGNFFTHVDMHDRPMRDALATSYRYAFRSAVWPMVFPEAKTLGEKPSEVDLLVHQRFGRAGLRAKTAIQRTALGILAKEAAALAKDAEAKGRADQKSAAVAAQAAVQDANNTTTLVNHADLQAAREESTDMQIEAFETTAVEASKKSTAALFEVGSIQ
jgi:hypothetical protein